MSEIAIAEEEAAQFEELAVAAEAARKTLEAALKWHKEEEQRITSTGLQMWNHLRTKYQLSPKKGYKFDPSTKMILEGSEEEK